MLKAKLESATGEQPSLPMADCSPHSQEKYAQDEYAQDEYETVRILVIGSAVGVNSTIRTLYLLGFSQISDWSPVLPAPNSGDVMRILTRRLPGDRSA